MSFFTRARRDKDSDGLGVHLQSAEYENQTSLMIQEEADLEEIEYTKSVISISPKKDIEPTATPKTLTTNGKSKPHTSAFEQQQQQELEKLVFASNANISSSDLIAVLPIPATASNVNPTTKRKTKHTKTRSQDYQLHVPSAAADAPVTKRSPVQAAARPATSHHRRVRSNIDSSKSKKVSPLRMIVSPSFESGSRSVRSRSETEFGIATPSKSRSTNVAGTRRSSKVKKQPHNKKKHHNNNMKNDEDEKVPESNFLQSPKNNSSKNKIPTRNESGISEMESHAQDLAELDKQQQQRRYPTPRPGKKYIDAFEKMVEGSALLKVGRAGTPHFLYFALSSDHRQILWFSKKKTIDESQVDIADIEKVIDMTEEFGIRRSVNSELMKYAYLSFSIVTKFNRTLNLIAKTEDEKNIWMEGLRALINKHNFHYYDMEVNEVVDGKEIISFDKKYREKKPREYWLTEFEYMEKRFVKMEDECQNFINAYADEIIRQIRGIISTARDFESMEYRVWYLAVHIEVLDQVINAR